MKVSDVMTQPHFTVSPQAPLSEVRRLIYSLGLSSIPVVEGKKIVGVITENDITNFISPTIQKILKGKKKNNLEEEGDLSELLQVPAEKIMNTKVMTVSPDTQAEDAQELLLKLKYDRLAVVRGNNELIGIISHGDIFRHIMKTQIPLLHQERYAKFAAVYYDQVTDWETRFELELPAILRAFRRNIVETVLEVGSWTGEYSLELINYNIKQVIGLDHNPLMIDISIMKREKLPKNKRGKVSFQLTDFTHFAQEVHEKFDAVICIGNALSYINKDPLKIFEQVADVLVPGGIFLLQVYNFEKILKGRDRLLSFKIHKANGNNTDVKEHLFLEFFDIRGKNNLLHNIITFDSDGKRWTYKGLNSVSIMSFTQEGIDEALKKAGFSSISYSGNKGAYQGNYGQLSFTKPFDPYESDWLNVYAKKS